MNDGAKFAELIRGVVSDWLAVGVEADEVAFILTQLLPELVDRRRAHAHVGVAFDLAGRDNDRALPFETGPFDRMDP